MRNIIFIMIPIFTLFTGDKKTNKANQNIISSETDNFWNPYDNRSFSKDTTPKTELLKGYSYQTLNILVTH